MNILIVKTSALGDIIQSFSVLDYLHARIPNVAIDWAVEESLASLVSAHPLVRKSIPVYIKDLKKGTSSWKKFFSSVLLLRRQKYDLLFDLQGNCKSGLITFSARAKTKVGFGRHSVREWPNILTTNTRFNVSKNSNIRLQYLGLAQQYFRDSSPPSLNGVRFTISTEEQQKVNSIVARFPQKTRIMVCPGSRWINKQLPFATLAPFLQRLKEELDASFFLMWGAEEEKFLCQQLQEALPDCSAIIKKLSIPTWQNLMNEMKVVIAADSSALHLCGTTQTPSFSLFGPTSLQIFKPVGEKHLALAGPCPYGQTFLKVCPQLRSCETGACIRSLSADHIYKEFISWWYRDIVRLKQQECSTAAPSSDQIRAELSDFVPLSKIRQ